MRGNGASPMFDGAGLPASSTGTSAAFFSCAAAGSVRMAQLSAAAHALKRPLIVFPLKMNNWESVIGQATSLTLFFFLVKQFLVPPPRFQAMRHVGCMRIVGGPHSEAVIAPRK